MPFHDSNPIIFIIFVGSAIAIMVFIAAMFSDNEEGKSKPEETEEEIKLLREIRELKRRRALEKRRL